MFTAAFFGSWFAYVMITFALGFIWHLVVFKDIYHRLAIYTRIDDPIVPLGFLAMLIQGAVLAYVYPLIATGSNPIVDGIGFGLLMGVFLASSAVIAEVAKQRVTSLRTWFVLESSYYGIQFILTGLAIAFIHQML